MTRPSGRRSLSPSMISPSNARPVTSKTASSRFDAVSSGPNSRNVEALRLMMSRSQPPSTRVFSASTAPGNGTSTA